MAWSKFEDVNSNTIYTEDVYQHLLNSNVDCDFELSATSCLLCASELSSSTRYQIENGNRNKWSRSFHNLCHKYKQKISDIGNVNETNKCNSDFTKDNPTIPDELNTTINSILINAFYCLDCFTDLSAIHDMLALIEELEARLKKIKQAMQIKISQTLQHENDELNITTNINSNDNTIADEDSTDNAEIEIEIESMKQEGAETKIKIEDDTYADDDSILKKTDNVGKWKLADAREKLYRHLTSLSITMTPVPSWNSEKNNDSPFDNSASLQTETLEASTVQTMIENQNEYCHIEIDPVESQLVIYEQGSSLNPSLTSGNKQRTDQREELIQHQIFSGSSLIYAIPNPIKCNLGVENPNSFQSSQVLHRENRSSVVVDADSIDPNGNYNHHNYENSGNSMSSWNSNNQPQFQDDDQDRDHAEVSISIVPPKVSRYNQSFNQCKLYNRRLCCHLPRCASPFQTKLQRLQLQRKTNFHQGGTYEFKCLRQPCNFTCFQFDQLKLHYMRNHPNIDDLNLNQQQGHSETGTETTKERFQNTTDFPYFGFFNEFGSDANTSASRNSNVGQVEDLTDSNEKLFVCPYCIGRTVFFRKTSLRRHLKSFHPGMQKQCEKCKVENVFWEPTGSYAHHVATYHRSSKKEICHRCGQRYASFPQLTEHFLKCNLPLLPVTITLD